MKAQKDMELRDIARSPGTAIPKWRAFAHAKDRHHRGPPAPRDRNMPDELIRLAMAVEQPSILPPGEKHIALW